MLKLNLNFLMLFTSIALFGCSHSIDLEKNIELYPRFYETDCELMSQYVDVTENGFVFGLIPDSDTFKEMKINPDHYYAYKDEIEGANKEIFEDINNPEFASVTLINKDKLITIGDSEGFDINLLSDEMHNNEKESIRDNIEMRSDVITQQKLIYKTANVNYWVDAQVKFTDSFSNKVRSAIDLANNPGIPFAFVITCHSGRADEATWKEKYRSLRGIGAIKVDVEWLYTGKVTGDGRIYPRNWDFTCWKLVSRTGSGTVTFYNMLTFFYPMPISPEFDGPLPHLPK